MDPAVLGPADDAGRDSLAALFRALRVVAGLVCRSDARAFAVGADVPAPRGVSGIFVSRSRRASLAIEGRPDQDAAAILNGSAMRRAQRQQHMPGTLFDKIW